MANNTTTIPSKIKSLPSKVWKGASKTSKLTKEHPKEAGVLVLTGAAIAVVIGWIL